MLCSFMNTLSLLLLDLLQLIEGTSALSKIYDILGLRTFCTCYLQQYILYGIFNLFLYQ